MSTRQKPLLALWVYFDRQRFALGLPRIAQELDRMIMKTIGGDGLPKMN